MPSLFYPLVITFLLFGYFKDFVFSANFTNLIVMWYSYLCVCMCVCVCVCVCVCMCVCVVFILFVVWWASCICGFLQIWKKFWPLFLCTVWVFLLSSQLQRCKLYVCWTAWNFPCVSEALFTIFSVSFSLCFSLSGMWSQVDLRKYHYEQS